jgi:hypothetical protein
MCLADCVSRIVQERHSLLSYAIHFLTGVLTALSAVGNPLDLGAQALQAGREFTCESFGILVICHPTTLAGARRRTPLLLRPRTPS